MRIREGRGIGVVKMRDGEEGIVRIREGRGRVL